MKKRSITFEKYLDKVQGAWMGKSLGGIVGAPVEAHKVKGNFNEKNCWPTILYPNDDLDIQVVWLEMLEEIGLDISKYDMVNYWQDRCWYNFSEYGFFLNNVQRGIAPPLSGTFNNEMYCESMGCPIRSEIWSLINPGDTNKAAELAKMDGELDHKGNSVYAEQFWAAAGAEAFFAKNFNEVILAGRLVIPKDSKIFGISVEVENLWNTIGDWEKIWLMLVRKYGHRDNSKVEINFAFTLLSLYAGENNFKNIIITAINCGWDADCTAATAGALFGILNGTDGIPKDWKDLMGPNLTCDVNVKHKISSLYDFSVDTCKVGLEMLVFKNNNQLEITEVPYEISEEVENRFKNRTEKKKITIDAIYVDEPVLFRKKSTRVVLEISNNYEKKINADITIKAPDNFEISPISSKILLMPLSKQSITLFISLDKNAEVLLDKNLFLAVLKADDGEVIDCKFGLVGAKQWMVYGPYWDFYDRKNRGDICPFRNGKTVVHPCTVGNGEVLVHNFVVDTHEYLDEKLLFENHIEKETPFLVERGENTIDESHLGGFFGEAVYYLVRDIIASEPIDCVLSFGSSVPFIAYLDGNELFRFKENYTWGVVDIRTCVSLSNSPKRLVIKLIKTSDSFRFSASFIKADIAGDKLVGDSFLVDLTGDQLSK